MLTYLAYAFERITYPIRMIIMAPERLFAGPRRLMHLSLPARVALLTAVFLITCVITAYILFANTTDMASSKVWFDWKRMVTIGVLLIVIPPVVYKAVKLWMEGESSQFPDIERAWKAGVAELDKSGIKLGATPLFLVLGSPGEQDEKLLFEAAGLSLTIKEFPPGPAPLHWYANPDAVYLVCTDAGCLSRLSTLGKGFIEEAKSRPARAPVSSGSSAASQPATTDIRATMVAPSGSEPSIRESITGSRIFSGEGNAPKVDIRGTMVLGGDASTGEAVPAYQERAIVLPPAEAVVQEQRLEYVCQLIRKARQPYCGVNGLLTLLPYGIIQRGPREGAQVQHAVQRDLLTLSRELKLRAPVTALVVGLEEESGFRELVRRVGIDKARAQRFGRGYDLWNAVIPEQLNALCIHACGSFEDWTYNLFREKDSLTKPGNKKLYALLCKVRRNVQDRLTNILVAGYARDADEDDKNKAGTEPMLFGGCYFAAAGEQGERQAFVKGVFQKLVEQQEDLEWTKAALLYEQRYRKWANIGLGIDFLLLLALGGMIAYMMYAGKK